MRRILARLAGVSRTESRVGAAMESLLYMGRRGVAAVLSDEMFLRAYYRARLGRSLRLESPVLFTEKIQWLKLYQRPSWQRQAVDKLAVREFVADRLGRHVLVELCGVYNSVESIEWETLPPRFVLKPTHGSGWVVICRDPETFSRDQAERKLRRWMRRDYYYHAREWMYHRLPRRIIAEEFLSNEDGSVPYDYKVFCFGGRAVCVQVDIDRFAGHRRDFYDRQWLRLDCEYVYPRSASPLPKPPAFDRMLVAAETLARGESFCRVDFYIVAGSLKFGEITFYPDNGVGQFRPEEWDLRFGEMLRLPMTDSLRHATSDVRQTTAEGL